MEQRYIEKLAEAYRRGYCRKYDGVVNPPEMKMHYFKEKDYLPRVQAVISFFQGKMPSDLASMPTVSVAKPM